MFIIRNSIGCGQCLRPKMLSDVSSFAFTLLLPNWLLISIRIYSGIARFPCDSMAFLSNLAFRLQNYNMVELSGDKRGGGQRKSFKNIDSFPKAFYRPTLKILEIGWC